MSRRGAVYVIRLTLPIDLRDVTGMVDIRKSLHTKDIDVARKRCLDAEIWFRGLVTQLRSKLNPTRRDIERAANLFFVQLQSQIDRPRDWPEEVFDGEAGNAIEESHRRNENLEYQLKTNLFDGWVDDNACRILAVMNLTPDQIDSHTLMLVKQLAARAERQQHRYLEHSLRKPTQQFVSDDDLFSEAEPEAVFSHPARSAPLIGQLLETLPSEKKSFKELIDLHLAKEADLGKSKSHIKEVERVLRWAIEEIGADTEISAISTASLRGLRDKLGQIDKTKISVSKYGQKTLNGSLTSQRANQIQSVTARRYWGYVKALFKMAVDDNYLQHDPVASLSVQLRKDEEAKSPEPYSTEELKRFLSLPIFTGRESKARQKNPGSYRVRDGYWWSGVLQAYTGMRGGELSQLLPEDFVFASEVPHILVRRENASGEKVKSAKNKSSIRAIPIADDLLILGIRQFIEHRAKKKPSQRVFSEFPLGSGGKISDGLSKFWRRYIIAFDLHKPGRAVHVWRHTVIYHLRKRGVSDEDIGYLVGHKVQSQTANYGEGELLERVRTNSLERLNYGFDVVELVGGPFNPKFHAE